MFVSLKAGSRAQAVCGWY